MRALHYRVDYSRTFHWMKWERKNLLLCESWKIFHFHFCPTRTCMRPGTHRQPALLTYLLFFMCILFVLIKSSMISSFLSSSHQYKKASRSPRIQLRIAKRYFVFSTQFPRRLLDVANSRGDRTLTTRCRFFDRKLLNEWVIRYSRAVGCCSAKPIFILQLFCVRLIRDIEHGDPNQLRITNCNWSD